MWGKGSVACALQVDRRYDPFLDLLYFHLVKVVQKKIGVEKKLRSALVAGINDTCTVEQNGEDFVVESFVTHL
jgi:hypothetical protein